MSAVEKPAEFSLEGVHRCLEEGKPVRALGHLLIIINLEPHLKIELRPVVLSVLGILSATLAAEKRYDDLMKCYREVLGVYSDNEVVLNNIGSQLYRFNHLTESRDYFQLACNLNSTYLPAFRNLQNVTNMLVERWHFRMLNDSLRNDTYRKAISKKVGKNSPTVIDIGTGTGLLSLYVSEAGAEYVCACDYSTVMTSIAQKVFSSNLSPDSVNVVNKVSSEMRIPDDLPFRCSLVVTETMDSGLLGEQLLSTLDHAWDELLLPPTPSNPIRVIPRGASLFAAPIESLKIARKNQLIPQDRMPTPPDPGDLDWTDIIAHRIKSEPYDTENLLDDPGCRYLSQPFKLFDFDFNSPQEIKRRLHCDVVNNITTKVTSSGYLDAIAVWFEAYLDDELTITTSPLSPNRCSSWHHAIFSCQPSFIINSDSELHLTSSCFQGVLNVSVDQDPSANKTVISLTEPVIRFLNSSSYLSSLRKSITRVTEHDLPINKVVDMSLFPSEGLLMSKNFDSKLLAINEIPTYVLKKLIKQNKIKLDLVTRLTSREFQSSNSVDSEDKYDLLIANFVEFRGEISQEVLKIAEEVMRKFLKPGATIIPSKTEIWGRLVSSAQLLNENRVLNPQLSEFRLGEFINEFQVSTHLDISTDDLEFISMSEPFLIGTIPTSLMCSKDNQSWSVKVQCSKAGTVNALLYWFNINLFDDISYSTNVNDSFASHAAEILPSDILVSCSDFLLINCLYNYGVIKIDVSR